jgi:hypothetical protein
MSGFIFLVVFKVKYDLWQEKKLCTKEVYGKLSKKEEYKDFNNNICYWLTFSYQYEGKDYENYVIDKVTKKQSLEFNDKTNYKLYLNLNNPDKIRLDRKILSAEDICTLLFSGFMLVGIALLLIQWCMKYIFC